jgi:dienelactone hydrolase
MIDSGVHVHAVPLSLTLAILNTLACSAPSAEDDSSGAVTETTQPTGTTGQTGETETIGETETSSAPEQPVPAYTEVLSVELALPGSGDPTDVFYPADADGPLPLLVLLQGAQVPNHYYEPYARQVAAWGFVVAVPNHPAEAFGGALFATPGTITEAYDHLTALASEPDSELFERVDPSALGALGHSFGGVAAIQGMIGACQPPICAGPYTPPDALRAGAFYGTNLMPPTEDPIPATPNMGTALALIQGDRDGVASVAEAIETWEKIETPPKVYVEIAGANHYGITRQDNPPESAPDPSTPTLAQDAAIEVIARWAALFMRAHLLDDDEAFAWIYAGGADNDELASVMAVAP